MAALRLMDGPWHRQPLVSRLVITLITFVAKEVRQEIIKTLQFFVLVFIPRVS